MNGKCVYCYHPISSVHDSECVVYGYSVDISSSRTEEEIDNMEEIERTDGDYWGEIERFQYIFRVRQREQRQHNAHTTGV